MKSISQPHRFYHFDRIENLDQLNMVIADFSARVEEVFDLLFRTQVDLTKDVTGTLPVGSGGTGAVTLPAHTVLLGEGTAPIATTGPGTVGQVLTSNGPSADPTFQKAAGGLTNAQLAARIALDLIGGSSSSSGVGQQGPQGIQGVQGIQGIQGVAGQPGQSVISNIEDNVLDSTLNFHNVSSRDLSDIGSDQFFGNVKAATTQEFSWNAKNVNTVFQAASDGFVVGAFDFTFTSGAGPFVQGLSDASNPPITERAFIEGPIDSAANMSMTIMFPVRKGDFWEVVSTPGGGTITKRELNWVPLGTAG